MTRMNAAEWNRRADVGGKMRVRCCVAQPLGSADEGTERPQQQVEDDCRPPDCDPPASESVCGVGDRGDGKGCRQLRHRSDEHVDDTGAVSADGSSPGDEPDTCQKQHEGCRDCRRGGSGEQTGHRGDGGSEEYFRATRPVVLAQVPDHGVTPNSWAKAAMNPLLVL